MPYHLRGKEPLKDTVSAVLRKSGGEVLHKDDVIDLVRRRRHLESTSSVGSTLSQLRKEGLVENTSKGRWRWIGESE